MRILAFLCIGAVLFIGVTACSNPRLYVEEQPDKEKGTQHELKTEEYKVAESPYDSDNIYEDSDRLFVEGVSASLYFYDRENNRLVSESRQLIIYNEDELVKKVVSELINGPRINGGEPVIHEETRINSIDISEGIVNIDLSSEFLKTEDLLVSRVALVNTLTDLDAIRYVKIYIDGEELTYTGKKDDTVLGIMSKYSNNLNEVLSGELVVEGENTVIKTNREIFFTDLQGTYLLPEVRTITVQGKKYAHAIIEELIKGPMDNNQGLYATIPKGVQILRTVLIDEEDGDGIELYFSKEFKTEFKGGSSNEITTIGSIVYSLTALPNVEWVKIFYENEKQEYIDYPIGNLDLNDRLTRDSFPDLIGRRIRIFYADNKGELLIPEFRVMNRNNPAIATKIIQELAGKPQSDEGSLIIPSKVTSGEIRVWMEGDIAIVDLPSEFFDAHEGMPGRMIRLFAIVNSLTDPINTRNLKQVKFLVEGENIDEYDNISLKSTFVRNPALIKE